MPESFEMGENAPAVFKPPYLPGDGIPWLKLPSDIRKDFDLATLAGRRAVLCFLGSFCNQETASAFAVWQKEFARFGHGDWVLVLVSIDPRDAGAAVPNGVYGVRYVFDFDGKASTVFGALGADGRFSPQCLLLDERLRVTSVLQFANAATMVSETVEAISAVSPIAAEAPAPNHAPVLLIPDVFEKELCRRLIDGYCKNGGRESGFMVQKAGKTVLVHDYEHKRRSDWIISDETLKADIRQRIRRRLLPEVWRAFQFKVTQLERHLVACYDAASGGHFNAHRDNTTRGTAHRRFAVTLNLNAEEYAGGELMFPEFGRGLYRPPTGGACVFSCSLMHRATRVTQGSRYAYLPFLYDNAAAEVRAQNLAYLEPPPQELGSEST